MKPKGKVAIVTCATRSSGEAMCTNFSKEVANVIVASLIEAGIKELLGKIYHMSSLTKIARVSWAHCH
jgi:NAD(P)-dependent dehydrogenase (short-subunit alcohol dehydrogenase family)